MLMSLRPTALVIAALALLTQAATAQSEPLKIAGSVTICNMIAKKKAAIEKRAGLALELVPNQTGRGVADVLAGRAEISAIGGPVEPIVEQLGVKQTDLALTTLPSSKIAFVVHPSNPVRKLTLAQVTDMLSGKIANWKDVGGADLTIDVVIGGKQNGWTTTIRHSLLKGGAYAAKARVIEDAKSVQLVAAQLPGAISFGAAEYDLKGVAFLETDAPVEFPFYLATKAAPAPAAAQLVAAIAAELK